MDDNAERKEVGGEYGTDWCVETEIGGALEEGDIKVLVDGGFEDVAAGFVGKYTEVDAEEVLDGGIVPNTDVDAEGNIDGAIE